MPSLYFTPASVGYLNQFLLSLLIVIYLGARLFSRERDMAQRQEVLLLFFFAFVTIFSFLLFLEASFLPFERFIVVCLENTVLAILLAALIQFTYHFPAVVEKQKTERRIAFAITVLYTLMEAGIAAWRLLLLRDGPVEVRPPWMDIPVALEFAWVIFVFARSSVRNWNQHFTRQFALIFLIPLWLAVFNILRSFYTLSTSIYHINLSIGILFTIFLFALIYLVSQPEKTSFITKLSATVLTGVLAVFGAIAWLVAPAYANQYRPSILDHRTIEFVPNERGGYDVSEIPFQFEEQIGQNLYLTDETGDADRIVHQLAFDFPFLGQPYETIRISNDGIIGIGSPFTWRDYQNRFTNVPMIIPLLVDLNPQLDSESGVFLRQEEGRVVVTYFNIPSYNHPKAQYTFQVTLFANGSFRFTYNGLPDFTFYVDDRPEATAWAIGYKPASAPQSNANFTALPLQGGPEGLLQDEYRAFRIYMHSFMLPVILAVLAASLLFLAGLPLLLKVNFARPLDALLQGVQDFNRGKHGINIPILWNDEIGFLAATFNHMTREMDALISDLESHVAERTMELTKVNRALLDSQKFFEELFEASPDAILTVNPQGQITQVNARVETLFGYERKELIGKTIEILIPAKLASSQSQKRANYLASPHARTIGHAPGMNGCRKDGSEFPVEILLNPFKSKEDQLTLVVVRDVIERIEMENALYRRNETLAALDQMMLDLLNHHEVDDILNTLLVKVGPLLKAQDISIDLLENGDTLVTYAATPNQPLQTGDTMRRGEGGWLSWQAVDTRQPAILEDYSTWERRREMFEGHPIHAISIIPILQGEQVAGTINFSRATPNQPFDETDIFAGTQLAQMAALALDNAKLYNQLRTELSERRQIEEVLRISQNNFMSYFNMGTVGMCVTSPEQNWMEVNDRLCEMLGYTRDELKQIPWSKVTHPDDLEADLALFEETLHNERESYQLDKRFIRRDGGVVHTSMFVSCQRHLDGAVRYFLVSLVDITERIKQEEILRQTQAELMNQKLNSATLEERQRLARNLHDSLNQSIHSLVLFSETLVAAIEKKNLERAKRIVEQVYESARQSLKETRLMLFELQVPGQGRSVNLVRDLEERLAKVENHAGIRSQIIQKGNLESIPSSWQENLYWITIEALNNALKHAQARKITIEIRASAHEMELHVTDDGRGFFPDKMGAGGMGMENMRARAALLGGTLTVDSKPAGGTSIRFHAQI